MTTSSRRVARQRRSDRGVALLEMTMIAPFLLMLLFGIAEFGVVLTSSNRLDGAVSTAARTGSSSGSVADADRNILLSLRASLPADLLQNVLRVVVFSSNGNGDIAAACLTISPGSGVGSGSASTGANRCNTYSGAVLRGVTATTDLGSADNSWPPTVRRDRLSGPPDFIGVLVETRASAITGLFAQTFDIEGRSIFRIQPDVNG